MSTRRERVLLIEDNDASAGDYVRWLKAAKYGVERASAASDGVAKAKSFEPDVVILDLQIPLEPGHVGDDVEHGLGALDELLRERPFRPVVIATAHSRDRELMRRVMQRNRGGGFVFKDAEDLERELLQAVAVAVEGPAYKMSKTVAEFRALVDKELKEDEYRTFIHRHWEVILGPEYKDCRSPYEIARGAEIDLLAIRRDGFPDLWELKRPEHPVFTRYNQWLHHSVECARAVGQLMHYYDAAQREPQPGKLSYDDRRGVPVELHRPRGFVVIGRNRSEQERERLRLENGFFAGITILTYDDLIERAEQFLSFLQRYKNGDDPR